MSHRFPVAVAAALAFAGAASGQITFRLDANIDVSSTANGANPQFIGSNPSAVAWNGTSLWLGGYNASGVTANTGIVRVDTPLTAPTFGTAFGLVSTSNTRGITGLAVQGSTLAASFDNGTVAIPANPGDNSVRAFNANDGSVRWRIGDPAPAANDNTRRGNGVAFDPGFNGAGTNQGVAYLSIGSGRRHVLDTTTGAYINGQNAGAVINLTPTSTTWRDLAFDPATGDLYARESNRVTKAVRNGDNSFTGGGSTVLAPLTTTTTVDNENIAFVNSSQAGKLLAVNDRSVTTSGQAFTSVVKFFDTNGNAVSYSIVNPFGLTDIAATGNGAYDFAWDPVSQSLAISDFANRRVYLITPVPEPAGLLAAASAVGVVGWVRRRRVSY